MKISIIIPIYNSSTYLVECLTSIRNQSFTNFEVICLDDGSVDNSLEICHNFAKIDARFKVYSQENQGVSSARNNALKHCNGEYIGFVDSDDIIDNNYLLILHSLLVQSNVDLAVGHFTRKRSTLGSERKRTEEKTFSREDFINKQLSKKIQYPTLCCMLFKRSIIVGNNLSFRNDIYWGEDSLFYHEYIAIMRGWISVSPKYLYFYRNNVSSSMNTVVTQKALSAILAAQIAERTLRQASLIPEKSASSTSETILKLTYIAAKSDNLDLYEYLHQQYDIRSHANHILRKNSNVTKQKLLPCLYLILNKSIYYKTLSIHRSIINKIKKISKK